MTKWSLILLEVHTRCWKLFFPTSWKSFFYFKKTADSGICFSSPTSHALLSDIASQNIYHNMSIVPAKNNVLDFINVYLFSLQLVRLLNPILSEQFGMKVIIWCFCALFKNIKKKKIKLLFGCIFCLMPNCMFHYIGAKLSGFQIVHILSWS